MRHPAPVFHGWLLGAAMLVLAIAPSSPAAAEEADLLSAQRWREDSFGLSLRQPLDFQRVDNPGDGALVEFFDDDATSIAITLERSEKTIDLSLLKEQVVAELSGGSRQPVVLDDRAVQPAGRPGVATFFQITDFNGRPALFGHAIVQLDPHHAAIVRLDASIENPERKLALFNALIDSIDLDDPRELDRIRTAWIQAGQRWHEGIDREHLQKAMVPEQWLRIVGPDGSDVGYARIRHRIETMLGVPGIHVEINSRIIVDEQSYDTESFYFESDDESVEVWSVRTAMRSSRQQPAELRANVPGFGAQVALETGLRSGQKITVRREMPGSRDDLEWATPPQGYLSQVEIQLLPALLPRNRQHEFAFYAYNSGGAGIGLRTIQVYPQDDGGYVVRERPAPGRGEQITTYNARGQLVRRQMADGMVMLPATAEQMRAIWDIR